MCKNLCLCPKINYYNTNPEQILFAEILSEEKIKSLLESPDELMRFQKEVHKKFFIKTPVKMKAPKRKLNNTTPDGKLKQAKILDFLDITPSPDRSMKQSNIMDFFKKHQESETTTTQEVCSTNHITRELNYSDSEASKASKRRRHSSSSDSLIEIDDTESSGSKSKTNRKTNSTRSYSPPPKQRKSTMKRSSAALNVKEKEEYVVEDIEEIGEVESFPFFFVKWKGYSRKVNTWEPLKNVHDCDRFQTFLKAEFDTYHVEVAEIMTLLKSDEDYIDFVENYENKSFVEKLRDAENFDEFQYKSDLILFAIRRATNAKIEPRKILERLRSNLKKMMSFEKRKAQLQQMEKFIMNVNLHEQKCKISIENFVDFDAPIFNNFTYINENKPGDDVFIPDEAPFGCQCEKCDNRSACCGKFHESKMAYLSSKKLSVKPGTPIYECNSKCKCGPDCTNRVVQQGRKLNLILFKTANGRGWGVKTNLAITQGSYVAEYVGEVITADEAEKRGELYDAVGRTYLFDLDFFGDDNPYTIDAANFGNLTRFINHSCDPNCGIWPVWIECLDPNLPRLAFFAKRRIEAGEELTFSYVSQADGPNNRSVDTSQDEGDEVDKNKKEITECKCGAYNCQKYVF